MKIVFAIKSMNSLGGGAERVLADVTNGLAERGHQISILTYDQPNGKSFYPLHEAIKRIDLNIGRTQHRSTFIETVKRMIALRREIKKVSPDIIVGFMHSLFLPLGISLIGTKIPVLASEHTGVDYYRNHPFERLLIQLTPLITKNIVVVSKNIRDGFNLYRRKNMKVIPNPVCIPVDAKKEQVSFDRNRKTLLSIGRLVDLKDHKTLLEAFSRLTDDFLDWDLKIFGDGELRSQLETQVKKLGLEGRIQLAGTKQSIADEFLGAQLYVVPSLYEGFGLATAEALAYGLPAVGFADCPGTNELIEHELNGLLVDGDCRISALERGLRRLMESPDLRNRLGKAGPLSMSRFSKENICSLWEKLLPTLMPVGSGSNRHMKIAINATCFNNTPSRARNRFIGIYTQLFRRLSEDQFFVFEPKDCNISDWFPPLQNVRFIKTSQLSDRSLQRYLKGWLFWNRALKKINPDIFETWNLPLIKSPAGRTILTVHDIRYVRVPKMYSTLRRIISRQVVRSALKKSDIVVTGANAIKKELLDVCPKGKISVIYGGIDTEPFFALSNDELSKVRKKYNLPQKFILSVGRFEKRKNYPRLLEALSLLNKNGHNLYLVIIGDAGDDLDASLEQINFLNLSENVKILKNVEEHDMNSLYRICSLLVFPSIYEGFGFPILEAMAAQCPMVVSDLPVFREMTENQLLYFDPHDAESIAQVIWKVYDSTSEQKRVIDYGLKRLDVFNYENIAQDVEEVYRFADNSQIL